MSKKIFITDVEKEETLQTFILETYLTISESSSLLVL